MRPFTSVLVVIMLAVAPVTAASAQVSNSSPGSPLPGQTGGTQQQPQSIPLVIPPSLPDTSALDGRIPAPLQAPPQPPTINGPVSLTPLPAQPPEPDRRTRVIRPDEHDLLADGIEHAQYKKHICISGVG